MVRILKSMPIVVMNEGVHASSQKRSRRHDLPTPVYRGLNDDILEMGAAYQSRQLGGAGKDKLLQLSQGQQKGNIYFDEEIIVRRGHCAVVVRKRLRILEWI